MEEQLVKISERKVTDPADQVISKIKELINSGVLKPGDRLPAERKMASDFGFGRTHIREALYKLEFYGIIKTLPQSGSIINGLDISTLDGLISDVLNLQDYDFFSLVETRLVLEVKAIRLCAERWKEEDMEALEKAHEEYMAHQDSPHKVSKDFAFHRAIAEASHNPVIKAMLLILIPDIMTVYERERICVNNTVAGTEHGEMLDALKNRDADLAASLMEVHQRGVVAFAKERIESKKLQSA
jgi:GntR family transcriptional repressor for pyruvate dehydrogenase complex